VQAGGQAGERAEGEDEVKLIDDIEKMIAANPELITLRTRDAKRLIEWARRTSDKRRNMDTQRMRLAMVWAAKTLRTVADRLDKVKN